MIKPTSNKRSSKHLSRNLKSCKGTLLIVATAKHDSEFGYCKGLVVTFDNRFHFLRQPQGSSPKTCRHHRTPTSVRRHHSRQPSLLPVDEFYDWHPSLLSVSPSGWLLYVTRSERKKEGETSEGSLTPSRWTPYHHTPMTHLKPRSGLYPWVVVTSVLI